MAPNIHQTRLNSLSNSIVGHEILLQSKAAITPASSITERVDSTSYWEWRSEPDPAIFSPARIVELILLQQANRKRDASEEINHSSRPIAEIDDYWAEARFASAREVPQVKRSLISAVHVAPQYWDEAAHAQSSTDSYWNW